MGHRAGASDQPTGARLWVERLGVLAFWVLVWQVLSLLVDSPLLLCGPTDAACALLNNVFSTRFWHTVWFSFWHISLGIAVAFLLGSVLGIVSSASTVFRRLLDPFVELMKSVPIACIIVLMLIWFGSSLVSIACVFLAVFPPLYFAVEAALRARDPGIADMLRVYHVPPLRRFLAFSWPSFEPFLTAAGKTAVGMGWKSGIAAEVIGIPAGSMGTAIYQSKITLDTTELFAWTIAIVILSWACEKLFLWLLQASRSWSLAHALPKRVLSTADSPSFSTTVADGGGAGRVGLHDVTVAYGERCGAKTVFSHLDATFESGERYALTWPSGAGKTTLFAVVTKRVVPRGGIVTSPSRISASFQDDRLIESYSAVDNLRLVAGEYRTEEELERLARELLDPQDIHLPVSGYSGGMRRRVGLIRAIAMPSDAVVLDEPFSGLDSANHDRALRFLKRHLEGRTLLIATHDIEDANTLGARIHRLAR